MWPQSPGVKSGLQEAWATWTKRAQKNRNLNIYIIKLYCAIAVNSILNKYTVFDSIVVCLYLCTHCMLTCKRALCYSASDHRVQKPGCCPHSREMRRILGEGIAATPNVLHRRTLHRFWLSNSIHTRHAQTSTLQSFQSIYKTRLLQVTIQNSQWSSTRKLLRGLS